MRLAYRAWVVATAVLGLMLVVAILGRWVVHGPVDARSLNVSVSIAAGSTDVLLGHPLVCDAPRGRTWPCTIVDRSGSGVGDYDVTVDVDGSCWRARLTFDGAAEGTTLPGRMRGCVHLWQWSLTDPFP